ncbi:hypothetical protein BpHYR1_034763 [Brachionus plicatilis]|uniref:Uncharacterized protein n=1 Tax=Brachionus plicatilis TaxID=10195 RepID=A0A3M7S2B9_BRAPC|nr:hypothetical protein BpHYR1_034763 [Brachionus plicatilis]
MSVKCSVQKGEKKGNFTLFAITFERNKLFTICLYISSPFRPIFVQDFHVYGPTYICSIER